MPFFLKDRDFVREISGVRSALIVPCRFCPAASLAVREGKPYIELFRTFLRTASYESYIRAVKSHLGDAGVRTEIFESRLPHHFVMCMWASARRKQLAKRASGHDALVVLGCDAAVETARDCVKTTNCRVVPGMEVEGIMNVVPTVQLPFNISLGLTSVTRVLK